MLAFGRYFLLFICYSFMGWLCETVYCSVGQRKLADRGFLNGPLCPVYGFGALTVVLALGRIQGGPLTIFIVGIVFTTVLEYITSVLLEKLFHAKWWDYTGKWCNINGRVCLRNSILFGLLSVVLVMWIHPWLTGLIDRLPDALHLSFTVVLLSVLLADLFVSVRAALGVRAQSLQATAIASEIKARLDSAGFGAGVPLRERLESLVKEGRGAQQWEELRENVHANLNKIKGELEKRRLSQKRLHRAFPNLRFASKEEMGEHLRQFVNDKRTEWDTLWREMRDKNDK